MVIVQQIKTSKDEEIIIDEDEFNNLKQYTWYISNGYVLGKINNKQIRLHRYIMKCDNIIKVVDHINKNPLDNRKSNLRICTRQQNNCNSTKRKNATSKYHGVYFNKRSKSWNTSCSIDGKFKHIGYFKNEIDAAKAYDNYIKLNGTEFYNLNFPEITSNL